MGPEGLSVRWEIDSKTLQSAIFLRPEVSIPSNVHADCLSSVSAAHLRFDPYKACVGPQLGIVIIITSL